MSDSYSGAQEVGCNLHWQLINCCQLVQIAANLPSLCWFICCPIAFHICAWAKPWGGGIFASTLKSSTERAEQHAKQWHGFYCHHLQWGLVCQWHTMKTAAKDIKIISSSLNSDLASLNSWMVNNRLTLNLKTMCILLGTTRGWQSCVRKNFISKQTEYPLRRWRKLSFSVWPLMALCLGNNMWMQLPAKSAGD